MGLEITINGNNLTLDTVYNVAYNSNMRVLIAKSAQQKVAESRAVIEQIIKQGQIVYGVNTGFGSFKDRIINSEQTEELQTNLIKSHAIGVGPFFSEPEVRAAILIRANSLIKGYSGIRIQVAESLLNLLNHNIYPYIPQQGSVGSSGDLAPLSHLVLVMMGEGEVLINNKRKPALETLKQNNIKPIKLSYKEGLALNNGTAFMTAVAALNIYNARLLLEWSDNSLAMSLEALRGTLDAYHNNVQEIRPHPGQIETARTIRNLCQNSQLIGPGNGYNNIQDSYSLRCAPQIHGAVKDTYNAVRKVIEIELNSTTDNPLVFPDQNKVISSDNFDGQPISTAMDSLAIAISELGTISERRIAKLVDPNYSNGLPAFLIPTNQAGLSSGFMIAQYTAAALVAENKVLSHPVSNDSIPTSANQEDHVSFGTIAARKCRDIITNTEKIIAIELMCAAQGLDFHQPLLPGLGVKKIYNLIRQKVTFLDQDRILYKDLEKILEIMKQLPSVHRTRPAKKNNWLIKTLKNGNMNSDFVQDVLTGFNDYPKKIPPQYFYDDRGSELFNQICRLPEYYPTRTEASIINGNIDLILSILNPGTALVELGSGSSEKTKLIIGSMIGRFGELHYVPIDISKKYLIENGKNLLKEFSGLNITSYNSTYTEALSDLLNTVKTNKLILFLGNSLGNLTPNNARELLKKIYSIMTPGDYLLLGLDLQKDAKIIEKAYNDEQGVTAAFNLNLLNRINRELGGNFNLENFKHLAYYNTEHNRIEMYIQSLKAQNVFIKKLNKEFRFAEKETIHTENSYKYTKTTIKALADESGLTLFAHATDIHQLFSINLLNK